MTRPPSRPPVESIELRLDAAGDAAVRELWQRVAAAGVNTMARHEYNYPHVTLAALAHTGGALAAARGELAATVAPLVGSEVRLIGLGLFPHRHSVLYATTLATTLMLHCHGQLHEALDAAGLETYPTTRPGGWTPHTTIAKRVRTEQLGDALMASVGVEWPIVTRVASIVHWDGASRVLTTIA